MQKLRKILTISVMAMTVLSMCMVATGDVSAATAGNLVKVDGASAVYYLGADNRLYVFPNQDVFFSWYSDFNSVVTISATELNSYGSPKANVVMRAGTKLIKRPIPTAPEVYAVQPNGVLRWIDSEATATTLYGANWATRVVDVVDSFFTNYNADNAKTNKVTAAAYPAGSLIKTSGDSTIYYVNTDGTVSKVINETAMNANRFNMNNVITVASTFVMPGAGTDITGALYTDTSQGGSSGPVADPNAGTGLSVALASDTPAAGTILADSTANEYPQALVAFSKVNLTASNDGDVKVTTVKFTRTGVAADADLGNMYLYDGDTKLAEYTSFSSKVVAFTNSAGLVTIPKGTTKTLTLKGDLARGATSVTSGKTIGFAVNASTDITTNGAAVSGSFPVTGNSMTTASVSDLGHVVVKSYTTIPATIKATDTNKELWSMNLTASDQNMQIKYLKFTMVGTIASTDIKNLALTVAGTQVGSTVTLNSDNTVIFDLSANPIILNSGVTKTLALRGDMNGGSGRVFKFTIQKAADMVVYDTNYGVYVTPHVNNGGGTATDQDAFSIVQPTTGNGTSVDAGTLTVGVATDSPTGNVADGGTGLTFAKFSFAAAGENVKVDNLGLTMTVTSATPTVLLKNVKLLLDGSQIGTTAATLGTSTTATSFTFSNTFIVPAGTTKYLTVVGDTTDSSVAANQIITVNLAEGSSNYTGMTTMTTNGTSAQSGRPLTVKSGTATAVKNTAFSDRSATNPTGAVSAAAAKIASFIVTAGGGEAINVTQLKLADNATTQLGDNFQNLKLMNGTTQIGSTISSLNTTAGTYTFTPSTAIQIAAGQQYVVDVYADIKSSAADTSTLLNPVVAFDKVTATGVSTGTDASYDTDVDLQKAYISGRGNLTVTLDSDTALAQQMLMGSTGVSLAKFKFAADATEDISISKLVINDIVTSAGTGTILNLKLMDGTTQVGQTVNFTGTYGTTTYAVFDGINLVIPKNSSKVLTITGDLNSYDNGGVSGSGQTLAILTTYDGTNAPISAVGASSGQSITTDYLDIGGTTDTDVNANQMGVYRSLISVAWASDTPSGSAVGGSAYTVAKINITNATNIGSYSATVKNLNFAISATGISLPSNRTLTVYKDSISSGNQLATSAFTGTGAGENFTNTNITEGNFTDLEISSGATKTLIVVLDTLDAGTNDRISINVDGSDVTWTDGVTATISAVNTTPLSPKTLTY